MTDSSNINELYRNIDTSIYFGAGLAIVGGSTAFTLASFGVSSPITLYTTVVGLGLVGGLVATLIPIELTNYEDKCDDKKPLPSPTKAIFKMFGLDSQGQQKTT